MDVLVVIDMQNDFIDGSLGTPEAVAIVPDVVEKIKNFKGTIFYTRDTHEETYLDTHEGKNLPVPHCIKGTGGWMLNPMIEESCRGEIIDKPTFGSKILGEKLKELDEKEAVTSITLVGLCTDICVISNALLIKAFLPETVITVDASCCAGVTVESHKRALDAMKVCQIQIMNESAL